MMVQRTHDVPFAGLLQDKARPFEEKLASGATPISVREANTTERARHWRWPPLDPVLLAARRSSGLYAWPRCWPTVDRVDRRGRTGRSWRYGESSTSYVE